MTPRPSAYEAANRKAAERILANPKADGISLVWAEKWLAAHPVIEPEPAEGQRDLFAEAPKQNP